MQDPAQVQGLRLFGSAGILNLVDMGQVRVQDVLSPLRGLNLVPLLAQDSIVDVVALGSVELVPGISPCLVCEQGGDSQEVQDLVGSVRGTIGPESSVGRVLPENLHDPVFRRLVEQAMEAMSLCSA